MPTLPEGSTPSISDTLLYFYLEHQQYIDIKVGTGQNNWKKHVLENKFQYLILKVVSYRMGQYIVQETKKNWQKKLSTIDSS